LYGGPGVRCDDRSSGSNAAMRDVAGWLDGSGPRRPGMIDGKGGLKGLNGDISLEQGFKIRTCDELYADVGTSSVQRGSHYTSSSS